MSKNWYSDLPQYYQRQIKAMGLDEAGMNRRRMLKGMAGAAGVAMLGKLNTRQAQAATQMTYMCWEGYNDPRIIDPFNKANDTEISFDLIVDSPGGFAKLQAGASREVDLVSSDMPWITRMGPAGLALELNPDDYKSQPLGNAGALGMGTLTISGGSAANSRRPSASRGKELTWPPP